MRFIVDFGGEPAPTLQWQRRLAGTDTWENLPSGADWGTTTLTILDFRSNFTMAGDQFRCVATNVFGTATSRAATNSSTMTCVSIRQAWRCG